MESGRKPVSNINKGECPVKKFLLLLLSTLLILSVATASA